MEPTPAQKRCPHCRQTRPQEMFRSARGKVTVRCADCLAVVRARARALRARLGPGGVRADNLWQNYRITPEQYDARRSAQGGCCQICGVHEDDITGSAPGRPRLDGAPPAGSFRLVVDHCHRTGQVRGLLCARCNAMIGQARDRPEVLRAAADYLEDDHGIAPPVGICRLRILDADPAGRPPRTIRFTHAVQVRIDGYLVRLQLGHTKTVVSSSGRYDGLGGGPGAIGAEAGG